MKTIDQAEKSRGTIARWLTEASYLLAFDTETTGVGMEQDRIVTACVVAIGAKGVMFKRNWLIDPVIPIPEGAAAIHKVTTEMARANGEAAGPAVLQIATAIRTAWAEGAAVVAMNAVFDLTILDRELRRHGHDGLTLGPVIDPLVLDRSHDRYRKGPRRLESLCAHWGVTLTNAHEAEADAMGAVNIVLKMAGDVQLDMGLDDLMQFQTDAHSEWARGLEAHMRRNGNVSDIVDESWPMRRSKP